MSMESFYSMQQPLGSWESQVPRDTVFELQTRQLLKMFVLMYLKFMEQLYQEMHYAGLMEHPT